MHTLTRVKPPAASLGPVTCERHIFEHDFKLTEIRFRDGRELDVFTCIMIHFDAFGSQKTVKRSVIH